MKLSWTPRQPDLIHWAAIASERAPDYPVIFAWSCFLLFHNEATAKPPAPRPEPIYYCATGVEMPLYEPRTDRKDQRDI